MDDEVTRVEQRDVAVLTSAEAGDILTSALAATGTTMQQWRVHSVHHRPGAGVSVGYAVTILTPAGAVQEYLVASTARIAGPPSDRLVRLTSGDIVVHVWRHPHDPALPGLEAATVPERIGRLLGLSRPPGVELLGYRPLRRAVVRLSSEEMPTGQAYVKVVRPSAVADMVHRHQLLTAAGVPAPHCVHHTADGLVVLAAGRGVPLATSLAAGLSVPQRAEVLENVVAVLDRLPAQVMEMPRRPSWTDRWRHYAHAAATAIPDHTDRIDRLADHIGALLEASDPGPDVPTHGDLYEANMLMEGTQVTTLLDVDAVGPGRRVDDLACMLAHVSVLPHVAPGTYPQVRELLADWVRRCSTLVDPVALRARCAGVALSLVAGARREGVAEDVWRRDAEGRLAEAEAWLTGT